MRRGRQAWTTDLAVLGRVTTVGALLGLLVGGVLGRLVMLLLARTNDHATGLISDDGFQMGRVTATGTLNLLLVGVGLGVLGAALYVGVRGLRVGPRWFQVVSVAGGAGVVVGAGLVHRDGVDFRVLDPAWLAVALFVALPTLYVALLTLVAERALAVPDPRAGTWWRPALLLWVPGAPLLGALVVGRLALTSLRPRLGTATAARLALAARVALAVVFAAAVADLTADLRAVS